MKRDKSYYDYGECHVCGERMEEKPIKQEFWIKGKLILVEDVPAGVCLRCGEKVVRADVGRWIRALIEDSKRLRKARTISVPVIKFAKKVAGAAPEDVELRSNRVTRPRSTAARYTARGHFLRFSGAPK